MWQLYSLDHTFTLGPLPPTVSPATGRTAAELCELCTRRGAQRARELGLGVALPVPERAIATDGDAPAAAVGEFTRADQAAAAAAAGE